MAVAMKKSAHLFVELKDDTSSNGLLQCHSPTKAESPITELPTPMIPHEENSSSSTQNIPQENGDYKLAFSTRSRTFNVGNMTESLKKSAHIFKDFLVDDKEHTIEPKTPLNRAMQIKCKENITPILNEKTPMNLSKMKCEKTITKYYQPIVATPNEKPSATTPINQLSAEDRAEIENSIRAFELETTMTTNRKLVIKPTRLMDRFHADDQAENVPERIDNFQSIRDEQKRVIMTKKSSTISRGSLYLKKTEMVKKNWQQIFKTTNSANQFYPHIGRKSPDSFGKFTFKSDEIISLTEDNFEIVPNSNGFIGFDELSTAFLACPSIDPRLLHAGWIQHHLTLIRIKLSAYELSFPAQFPNCLTPTNLLTHLKLRYDREIDRAQRSVIRRIIEHDSAASGRMCLYVSSCNVATSSLELCDGHYSVNAQLDYSLERALSAGKLSVGIKLLIHGAQLIGLDEPAHPLDAPTTMRLKLHANSTRRTSWTTKLGHCNNAIGAFPIRLDSVLPTGGQIGCVLVCIVRRYPLLYKQDGSNELLSERMYRRRLDAGQSITPENVEQLYVDAALEVERMEDVGCGDGAALENIEDNDDPAKLYRMIRLAKDPELVHTKLTRRQHDRILDYAENYRREAIEKKVREKMETSSESRQWSTLLKLKIIDANDPKRTSLLSIWNATEAHAAIKEGETYEICAATAIGSRDGCLLLGATKCTTVKRHSSQSVALKNPCLSISDIYESDRAAGTEFDTFGIVISLGAILPRAFQQVHIANDAGQLLAIHVWEGVKTYAWEDLIKLGRCLSICDLHFRTSRDNDQRVPIAYVSEVTTCNELVAAAHFDAIKDLNEFIQQCRLQINANECLSSPMTPPICQPKPQSYEAATSTTTPLRRLCLRKRTKLKLILSTTPKSRFRSPLIDATNEKK